jgi:hypothetical protein
MWVRCTLWFSSGKENGTVSLIYPPFHICSSCCLSYGLIASGSGPAGLSGAAGIGCRERAISVVKSNLLGSGH